MLKRALLKEFLQKIIISPYGLWHFFGTYKILENFKFWIFVFWSQMVENMLKRAPFDRIFTKNEKFIP